MSSVKNYLRRQADVNHFPTNSSRSNHNPNSPEVERPLSEYDNLSISTLQTQLADIKFRFDDNSPSMSSSQQNSANDNIPTNPPPKYENLIEPFSSQNDSNNRSNPRPVMSEAKSSFFGINQTTVPTTSTSTSSKDDELEKLIEDCANIKIVSSNDIQQYVNLINSGDVENEKISPTSSASGSSAVTASPSTTPTRGDRNSEAESNRSKSPKFILPEISSTPSQVSEDDLMGLGESWFKV